MPRLGSLLICEKIIIDQQQKPTLISLFQTLTAVVPEGQQFPADTIGSTAWSIFCEWFFSQDEFDKTFELHTEVLLPDGSPSAIRGHVTFAQIAKDGQGTRAYLNIFGMPIAQTGFVTVNVWVEHEGKKVTEVFPYQIKISHAHKPPEPNDGGTFGLALTQTKQATPQ